MEAPVFPNPDLGKEVFKRNKEKRKLKFNKELEILALVLQFISFWFAAPEIVGERILKKLEAWFVNGIKIIVNIIIGSFFLFIVYRSYVSGKVLGRWMGKQSPVFAVVICSVILATILIIIIFRKRLMAADKKFTNITYQRVVRPFFDMLIKKEDLRLRSLALGAILFTIGFALQIFVILVKE